MQSEPTRAEKANKCYEHQLKLWRGVIRQTEEAFVHPAFWQHDLFDRLRISIFRDGRLIWRVDLWGWTGLFRHVGHGGMCRVSSDATLMERRGFRQEVDGPTAERGWVDGISGRVGDERCVVD